MAYGKHRITLVLVDGHMLMTAMDMIMMSSRYINGAKASITHVKWGYGLHQDVNMSSTHIILWFSYVRTNVVTHGHACRDAVLLL